MNKEKEPLTPKQRLFVSFYLANGCNATKAAEQARYAHPDVQGPRLAKSEAVAAAIEVALSAAALSAGEVLKRLSDQARGVGDYLNLVELGQTQLVVVDWNRLVADGKSHLVEGWEYTKDGQLIIHWAKPQAALMALGRHRKLFTDRHEVDVNVRDVGIAESLDSKLAELFARSDAESVSGEPVTSGEG